MAQSGQVLGSYRLDRPLGQGGMGEVWRAHHVALGRAAAVKLVRPEVLGPGDPNAIERRFTREARATAQLTSPHTIDVYDFGRAQDGTFFYAMELLDGLDLEALVRQSGPVPPGRAVWLLQQVCASLAEAHHRGLVHRDVKPANIYACRQGLTCDFIKVLDFGLVKPALDGDIGRLTAAGAITGSPAYLAPEQAQAGEVDARTDVYALGGVAYWLLTGQVLFPAATSSWHMVMAHVEQPVEPPSIRLGRAIPADLEALILDCLAKSPASRPADAGVVATRLAACACAADWNGETAAAWWATQLPVSVVASAPATPPDHDAAAFGQTALATASVVAVAPAPLVRVTLPAEVAPAAMQPLQAAPVAMKPLEAERRAAVSQLRHHFAYSTLDIHEFERRIERALVAASQDDLQSVVADLPKIDSAGQALAAPAPVVAPPMYAVFGNIERRGAWQPARNLRSVCVFGSIELDFREAVLPPGQTVVHVTAVFGSVEVWVPAGMDVQVNGFGLFGNFADSAGSAAPVDAAAPSLCIVGAAVFGNVEVHRSRPRLP